MLILKALILEKKILIFSLHSQACSNFILSLLSLLPGLLHFRFDTKNVCLYELSYRNDGFPLRIFDDDKRMLMLYFTIQNLDALKTKESYLIGTTNLLIKTHKNTQADMLVDVDKSTIEFKCEKFQKLLQLNSGEKKFIWSILLNVQNHILPEEQSWNFFSFQ